MRGPRSRGRAGRRKGGPGQAGPARGAREGEGERAGRQIRRGRGRRAAGGAGSRAPTGAMHFECAVSGLPAPTRPAAPGAGSASGPVNSSRRLPRPGARCAPGRRKAGRQAGPGLPVPCSRSPRRDSVPGPAPPGPRGLGPAGLPPPGPSLARPRCDTTPRPPRTHQHRASRRVRPRPPAPSASARPGSAAAASPQRGPESAEAPPLTACSAPAHGAGRPRGCQQ